ncbi:hypothetical protein DM01DRAFT_1337996 [Hesseltinella vesiculosa]|uniref:Uncharacterized protein n=1 Tax=Hesseltinella vesiculosa TaxID=101127 RepID=A0A1X2GBE6_9FUNG|nr:hypothetical protein DM01DRAFT_1337996 [Hesseltinella vesiculosa]
MSKKNHDYYYSYTSPPTSASGSQSAEPSAPSLGQTDEAMSLPSYQDALGGTSPLPSHSEFEGLTRDTTIPPYNPDLNSYASVSSPTMFNTASKRHCFLGRPPPPGYSIYGAKFLTKKEGVISRDTHLNTDGEALVQFLQQHNTAPRLKINFHGYHEETHYRTRNTRDEDGNWREEREPVTKQVDDFQFSIDCSDEVSPQCHGIYVMPDPKTGAIKTVRELCDEYVHTNSQLKELRLTKVINWNYAQLTRAFTAAIRSHGYRHSVAITYELENYRIYVKSNSTISQMVDHKAIRVLFFITCLWILAWPILLLFRHQFGHRTLKSEWTMRCTEQQWYDQHLREVLSQISPVASFGNVPFII